MTSKRNFLISLAACIVAAVIGYSKEGVYSIVFNLEAALFGGLCLWDIYLYWKFRRP